MPQARWSIAGLGFGGFYMATSRAGLYRLYGQMLEVIIRRLGFASDWRAGDERRCRSICLMMRAISSRRRLPFDGVHFFIAIAPIFSGAFYFRIGFIYGRYDHALGRRAILASCRV